MREVLNLDDGIVSVTGQIPPAKRVEKWNGARLVVATPKVVVNDASNGVVDLSDFSV